MLVVANIIFGLLCLVLLGVLWCKTHQSSYNFVYIAWHYIILKRTPFMITQQLKKRNADIVSIEYFNSKVVIIFSTKYAKEALNCPHLNGRPKFFCNKFLSEGKSLAWNSVTDCWISTHSLALKSAKEYSLSVAYIDCTKATIIQILDTIGNTKNAFCPSAYIEQMMFIHRFKSIYGNQVPESKQQALIEGTTTLINMIFLDIWGRIINFAPFAPQLLYHKLQHIKDLAKAMCNIHHKIPIAHGTLCRMLTDHVEKKELPMDTVQLIAQDFFAAGLDTVPAVMLWILAYLAEYQEFQQIMSLEVKTLFINETDALDPWCAADTLLANKDKLVYLQAFLYEISRLSPVVSYCLPHSNNDEVSLLDVTIPKNAIVLVSILDAHKDEKVWKNPDTFNPLRFVNQVNGKVSLNMAATNNLITHGAGMRKCPGHKMSNVEVLLFTSLLVLSYSVKCPEGNSIFLQPQTAPSMVSKPKDFKVIFQKHTVKSEAG